MNDKRFCGVCATKGHASSECPRLDYHQVLPVPPQPTTVTTTSAKMTAPVIYIAATKSNDATSDADRKKAYRERHA